MALSLKPVSLGFVRIELHGGKAFLDCQIFEEWQTIIHELLRCGTTNSFELTRRIGLKRIDSQMIEGTIKASIGMTGIAKLESGLKGQIQTDLTFEEELSTKRTITFVAPKCGQFRIFQQQAVRVYKDEVER